MRNLLPCLLLCLALPATAAEPAEPVPGATPPGATPPAEPPAPGSVPPAAAKPAFAQLDANRFKLGEVEFDKTTRVIRFPATVNQRDKLLEYVLVHDKGKVHESLLRTAINPVHLNLALRLLRYQSSPELFPLRDEEGFPSGLMPAVDAKTKAAARVEIRVVWKTGDKEESASVNEWIENLSDGSPMPAGPWVYGGSVVYEGRFIAGETGDLIAIQTNQVAVFNYPGSDRENDDVWMPATKRVPAEGTQVTVEVRPWPPAAKASPVP